MGRAPTKLAWTLGAALFLVPLSMVAVLYGLRPPAGDCENDRVVGEMLLTWMVATGLGGLIAFPLFVVSTRDAVPARKWRYSLALPFALGVAAVISVIALVVFRTDPSCYI